MEKADYYNDEVLYEMVKCFKGRELAFFYKPGNLTPTELVLMNKDNPPIRGIKAHNISYLLSNFMRFKFMMKKYNIYYSLALLNNMPMFSYSPAERKRQYVNFSNNFDKYVIDYELGLDFDSEINNIKLGFDVALGNFLIIKNLFDDYKVRYHAKYSGDEGFHINVPSHFLPNLDFRGKVEFCNKVLNGLKTLFNLPGLDYRYINPKYPHGIRKMWKAPYSLDCKTNSVTLPLDDVLIDIFFDNKLEGLNLMKPDMVLKMNIRNRGLLLRGGNDYGMLNLCNDYFPELVGYFDYDETKSELNKSPVGDY